MNLPSESLGVVAYRAAPSGGGAHRKVLCALLSSGDGVDSGSR